MLKVLRILHKHGLQVNINKCKFSITRVEYLNMIVTTSSIEINTKKIETIPK